MIEIMKKSNNVAHRHEVGRIYMPLREAEFVMSKCDELLRGAGHEVKEGLCWSQRVENICEDTLSPEYEETLNMDYLIDVFRLLSDPVSIAVVKVGEAMAVPMPEFEACSREQQLCAVLSIRISGDSLKTYDVQDMKDEFRSIYIYSLHNYLARLPEKTVDFAPPIKVGAKRICSINIDENPSTGLVDDGFSITVSYETPAGESVAESVDNIETEDILSIMESIIRIKIPTIKELALDYLSKHDGNLYAREGFHSFFITIFRSLVGLESVWYEKDKDKVYLHCGCKEFEGDIDIESLSDDNLHLLRDLLENGK